MFNRKIFFFSEFFFKKKMHNLKIFNILAKQKDNTYFIKKITK